MLWQPGRMPARVDLSTDLNAPKASVTAALRRVHTLRTLTRGMLAIDAADGAHPLPALWPVDGTPVTLRVRPFHLPVGWRHTIRVVEADPALGVLRTEESGGAVRRWEHTIEVSSIDAGRTRYRDLVELDAGALTPIVALWAQAFYRVRQRRWRALARRLPSAAGATPERSERSAHPRTDHAPPVH